MRAFFLGLLIGALLGCVGVPTLKAQAYDNSADSCLVSTADNGGMHPNGLWQNGTICREGTGAIIWLRWTL